MNGIILQIYNHIMSMLFEAIDHNDKTAILIYKELIIFIINTYRARIIVEENDAIKEALKNKKEDK